MNVYLSDLLLFAQRNAFRDMGSGFRDKREHFDPTDLIFWVGTLVGLFAALAVLARVIARREQRQVYNSPRALFLSLCAAHNLDRHDRAALRKLAHHYGLRQPARLFVEPARFEAAMLDATLIQVRARIKSLRERLFLMPQGDTQPVPAGTAASEMQLAIDTVHLAAETAAEVNGAQANASEPAASTSPRGKPLVMVTVPQMPSSFAIDAAAGR